MVRNDTAKSLGTKNDSVIDTTAMNEELKQWLLETKQYAELIKKRKKTSEKPKQKPMGKCHICGEKEAKAICIKCDKFVCTKDYFHLVGLCKKCLSKEIGNKWKGTKSDWEKTLGVEWID
jgi:hypothetical protein